MDMVQLIGQCGGVSALADALGLDHSSVSKWKSRGRVPAERVGRISALTGIPPHRIRPDLFPEPPQAEVGQ